MPAYKYTAQYGSTDRGQIAIAAGTSEAQSDTISVNIDRTNMGRAEVIHVIEKIKAKILAEAWPPA
jgi:hypothetical protein